MDAFNKGAVVHPLTTHIEIFRLSGYTTIYQKREIGGHLHHVGGELSFSDLPNKIQILFNKFEQEKGTFSFVYNYKEGFVIINRGDFVYKVVTYDTVYLLE